MAFSSIGMLMLMSCYCYHRADSKYLGCYSSNHSNVFDKRHIRIDLTISLCVDLCSKENFTLIGLQYGRHCHCGREGLPYTQNERVKDSQCNITCHGGPKCGGNDVIAIYENFTYNGCYSYPEGNAFSFGGAFANMTLSLCLDLCQYFPLAGLTRGDQCFCDHNDQQKVLRGRANSLCSENGEVCSGGGKCGGYGFVAVWNEIEAIETTDELPITHEVLPDDPNQCKGTNKVGRNFLSVCIAFISGILLSCVAIYLTHRYQPQVLKQIMDYRQKGHYKVEDRYEHTTNSLNDRPTRRMTDTSPCTIQRKYLTNREPEIRHSYYAGSCTVSAVKTNDVEQEYFPIQDDRSLKDASVSVEDIHSSCEEHTKKATNSRIKKTRSWKTELAYAVSEVTLSDIQKGTNPPTGSCSSQDDNFSTDAVEYVDPDEFEYKTGKNMITSPETVLSSTYEADLSGTVKYLTLERDTKMDLAYAVSHVQMAASPTSTQASANFSLGNALTGNFDYVHSDECHYKLEKNLSESRESVTPEEVQSINGNTMEYTEINRKPPPVKEKPRSVLVRKFSTEDVVDTTSEYKASLSSSVK